MVKVNSIRISPPLLNSSCAWSSDLEQLQALYNSPYTGAVTTRTATLHGFKENESHVVSFARSSLSTINSYGYSPHPLEMYLSWIELILTSRSARAPPKPFIISVTSSDPVELQSMVQTIQDLRFRLKDTTSIAIELNTSCPNIPNCPPTAYEFPTLLPLLHVLQNEHAKDRTLTIGLKLPPFVYKDQFTEVLDNIKGLCTANSYRDVNEIPGCPIAFFTCTNTLGNNLLFADEAYPPTGPIPRAKSSISSEFAVPPALGGLAGESLHSLSLGNVYTFAQLLRDPEYNALRDITIIGVGGVTTREAADRMRRAGASVIGCATLFGREGVRAFEIIGEHSAATI